MQHLHDTEEIQTEATTPPSINLLGEPVLAATTEMSITGSSQMSHTATGENESVANDDMKEILIQQQENMRLHHIQEIITRRLPLILLISMLI